VDLCLDHCRYGWAEAPLAPPGPSDINGSSNTRLLVSQSEDSQLTKIGHSVWGEDCVGKDSAPIVTFGEKSTLRDCKLSHPRTQGLPLHFRIYICYTVRNYLYTTYYHAFVICKPGSGKAIYDNSQLPPDILSS
jgi:hypothetical protein